MLEVTVIKKPNSLCKNINCRKPFYACAYCTANLKWRSIACSPECYDAYVEQVITARAAGKEVNLLPERTDMTEDEVKELMQKPADEVAAITREELKDYVDDLAAVGLGGTIDKINEDIRDAQSEQLAEAGTDAEVVIEKIPVGRGRKKKDQSAQGNQGG